MLNPQQVQVLRCLDKSDKLGIDATIELLQKPLSEFGADLDPVHAGLCGIFLSCKSLKEIRIFLKKSLFVGNRLATLEFLDSGTSPTPLDRLLAMKPNENNTWANGGRPANIAWALDDIVNLIKSKHKEV